MKDRWLKHTAIKHMHLHFIAEQPEMEGEFSIFEEIEFQFTHAL